MHAKPGCLRQMMDVYEARGGGNVIAVEEVPWEQVHRYGVVGAKDWQGNAFAIDQMVEKPKREAAPSNLIISAATSCSPRSSRKSRSRRPAPAAKSRSPTP